MPPHDLEEGEPRSRRGLAVVGGLVGLVVLGGAVALGYRGIGGDPSGEPPIIRADASPNKVIADTDESEPAEGQGKLVYDRIGGTPSGAEERLVSREEPVFEVEGRDQQVRQIEIDAGRRGDEELASAEAAGNDEPRRVRTVVVRPDGTVVAPPAPSEPASTAVLPGAATDALRIAQGAEIEAGEDEAAGPSGQGTVTTVASEPQAAADFVPPAAQPQAEAEPAPQSDAQAEPAPQPAPEPQPQAAQPQQQQAAPQRTGQPLQLVPGTQTAQANTQVASAPAATAPALDNAAARQPFPSGTYVVQVASTRTEEEARGAAATLAQRHSGLVGSRRIGVERADLGDRGIFYRVGIGDLTSQADANALCERLKANGLDCFVRRN